MNDALKLLSNSLKPFGYHLRKYKAPNILHLPKCEKDNPEIKTLRCAQSGQYWTKDANLNEMIVFLRVCMRKDRNIDPKLRITGTNIEEATLRCINSLINAMKKAREIGTVSLIILDDRSDEDGLRALRNLLGACDFNWRIDQTKQQGQGHSLYEQFDRAKSHNALLYFVEDDYLHEENGLKAAWQFYKQIADDFETHSLIYPQEHACIHDDLYPSYIIVSPDRHWRTMRHATHTFITHGHIVRDYWRYFKNTKFVGVRKKRKWGSEARTTNKLFNHIPGFSPLIPVAVHLQFECLLPPFYDWKPLWEENHVPPK